MRRSKRRGASDRASLELFAELPGQQDNEVFASWGQRDLAIGDEVTIRVVEADAADPSAVVVQGVGEVESGEAMAWPLCSFCGQSHHDVHVLVRGRHACVCDRCLDALVALRQGPDS